MPYQDRHPSEPDGTASAAGSTSLTKVSEASNTRTIQIIILVGLLAAIVAALFGSL